MMEHNKEMVTINGHSFIKLPEGDYVKLSAIQVLIPLTSVGAVQTGILMEDNIRIDTELTAQEIIDY